VCVCVKSPSQKGGRAGGGFKNPYITLWEFRRTERVKESLTQEGQRGLKLHSVAAKVPEN
jgi:hypothetical protein